MRHMTTNDELDTLFTQLQNRLNSNDAAPCEHFGTSDDTGRNGLWGPNGPDTCLSHAWGSVASGRPRFFYAPEAVSLVNAKFCPACKASWYVAVARNLMLGIVA